MSIPLYYRAVLLDKDGNVVTNPGKEQNLKVFVDGGILANFPIDIFDHLKYIEDHSLDSTSYDDKGTFYNPQTLGLRLDRDEQIKYDQQLAGLAPYPITKFSDYMGAFYNLVEESLNRQKLSAHDWDRTISISTKGFGQRVRKLKEVEKNALFESGREGVQAFMSTK
jgi:NTE family protein